MEKLVYALWKSDAETLAAFNEGLLGPVRARLTELGLERLKINIVDEPVAGAPLYPASVRPLPSAMVSFWLNSAHVRRPYEAVLEQAAPRIAGWSVVESTVLPYRGTAGGDARTPGFSQIAFLTRLPLIAPDGFLADWMERHTQIGVETQDTFFYCQNIIVRALTPGAPGWAGIVEECYPIEALTDPLVYWKAGGSEAVGQQNMKREMESCERFLDMSQVNVILTGEYRIGGWRDADRGWAERE